MNLFNDIPLRSGYQQLPYQYTQQQRQQQQSYTEYHQQQRRNIGSSFLMQRTDEQKNSILNKQQRQQDQQSHMSYLGLQARAASSGIDRAPPITMNSGESRPLPYMKEAGEFDVICARGSVAANHPGNIRFKGIIRSKLTDYNAATSKVEKTLIVTAIVDAVRDYSRDGGFVKQDKTGAWYDVGDFLAREKIGQTIRDCLHAKYKSSTKAKKQRRRVVILNDSKPEITQVTSLPLPAPSPSPKPLLRKIARAKEEPTGKIEMPKEMKKKKPEEKKEKLEEEICVGKGKNITKGGTVAPPDPPEGTEVRKALRKQQELVRRMISMPSEVLHPEALEGEELWDRSAACLYE